MGCSCLFRHLREKTINTTIQYTVWIKIGKHSWKKLASKNIMSRVPTQTTQVENFSKQFN